MARVARLGVVIDSSGAKRGADETTAALGSIDKAAERASDTMRKASLAIGGLVSVGAIIRRVVNESVTAQNAQAQLEAAVASTGGAAGRTVSQMQALAAELQNITAFSDDAIQNAQALLLTFTNIKGDVFDDATRALVDMAARMGGDVTGAAIQLGKALNDPAQGMTALSRAGITFSDEQKRVVAAMQSTGDMAGAQRVVLEELSKEFGSSAAKARDTLGGALSALGNAFGDLLEVSRGSSNGVIAALDLITRNVGAVVAAVGVLATAFAARAFAAGLASAAQMATAIAKNRAEILAYAEAEVRNAAANKRDSAQRLAALTAERAELRALAVAERERLAVASARVARAVPVESLGALGGAVAQRDNAAVAFATKAQADSQKALTTIQERSIVVNGALATAKRTDAAASIAAAEANAALAGSATLATRASAGFATALNLVGGVPGLVVIGTIGAIVTVMSAFATAAEKAKEKAERLAVAYRDLSPAAVKAAIDTERLGLAQIQAQKVMTGVEFDAKQKAIAGAKERIAALEAITAAQTKAAKGAQTEALDVFAKKTADARAELEAFKTGGKLAAEAFKLANAEWSDASTKNRTLAEALKQNDAAALQLIASATTLARVQRDTAAATDGSTKAGKDRTKAAEAEAKAAKDLAAAILASAVDVQNKLAEADNEAAERRSKANAEIGKSIAARTKENQTIREQVAALGVSRGAYESLLIVQAQSVAVAEAEAIAVAAGTTLSAGEAQRIREQVAENARLLKVREALLELDGKSPFKIPAAETKEWADNLSSVATQAGQIAGIFGGIGTAITKAVQLASQFVTSLGAAQKAAKAAEAAKGTAGAGAANSAAQSASLSAGVNFATLVVTGIKYWHDSVRAASERAMQAAIALRELGNAAKKSAADYVLQATGTPLDQTLSQLRDAFGKVISDLLAAGAPRTAALGGRTAISTVPTAAEVDAAIAAYDKLVAAAKRAAEFQAKQADDELAARLATAQGRTAEAEAIRLQINFEKELEDARKAGASAALLAQIAQVQAAEAAFAARQKARTAAEFGAGLTAREQSVGGNDRGAFVTRQEIGSAKALTDAEDLVAAGTITAEMFERFKKLIGDEMVDALKKFDEAAAAALKAQQDDLAIRALLAQGNEAGAAALRREIANRMELEGVTDAALVAQIQYVQGLEAIAAETQRIAEINASIDTRMIAAYKTLDPVKAAELEKKRQEIDRAQEIAKASDAVTAARLAELFALEDQAAALIASTAAIQAQIDAAQRLADFNVGVDVEYLQATGRNFEADKLIIETERKRRLKENAQLGGDAESVRKINVIFDAKLDKLIAGTLQGTTNAAVSAAIAEGELITRSVSRSISSEEAVRLLDVATSQLAVLQVIATNTGGGAGGGVRINVTVQGGAYSGTPADVGRGIAEALAPMFDDALGRRVGVARRLTGADSL